MTGKPETDASGEPLYDLLYRFLSGICSGFLRAIHQTCQGAVAGSPP